MFNIVWRYTYSIRLFLIEAKYRYKGKKYKQKTYSKNIQSAKSIYTSLFHSASPHQALAGSAPRLSTRGTSPQQTTKNIFLVETKRCVRSFTGCADLNLAGICWVYVSCRKFSDAVMTIFSGQSVISRVYSSRFGNGTDRLEPRLRWY